VDATSVGRVPDRLTLLEAGASAVTGLTALQGVDDHLRLKPRETVLILGATGAVGTLAVQFARHRHARVVATATGADATATGAKATALIEKLGAEIVFDARNSAELERLEDIVPGGVDAVLAFTGSDALERYLDLVRSRGRVVFPNGIES
jgi:NADPH:quinone reductase-like Zn-dependent oxidoreductase